MVRGERFGCLRQWMAGGSGTEIQMCRRRTQKKIFQLPPPNSGCTKLTVVRLGHFFLQFCKLSLRRRLEIFLHAELSDGCLEVFDRGQHGMHSSYPEQASKQAKQKQASKQEEPLPTELLLFLRQLRATKLVLQYAARTHGVSADQ